MDNSIIKTRQETLARKLLRIISDGEILQIDERELREIAYLLDSFNVDTVRDLKEVLTAMPASKFIEMQTEKRPTCPNCFSIKFTDFGVDMIQCEVCSKVMEK